MAVLSRRSEVNLATCDERLQRVIKEAIKDTPIDFTITCGYRGKKEQDEAFAKGFSKVKYPNGKHNKKPSKAIDVVPYPNMWESSKAEFKMLSDHILGTAKKLGIKIKWGSDWNMNGRTDDEKFIDSPHYELVEV